MSDDNGLDVVDSFEVLYAKYKRLLNLTTPQPIETAPRNGTILDLFYSTYRIADAFWLDGMWQVALWDGTYRVASIEEPTHWQRLPSPPMQNDLMSELAVEWATTSITAKHKLDDADNPMGR